MTLKAYLSAQGFTYEAFANRIGVANASVVWRYANGLRMPRTAVMHRIVKETGGAVQPSDFYNQASEDEVA